MQQLQLGLQLHTPWAAAYWPTSRQHKQQLCWSRSSSCWQLCCPSAAEPCHHTQAMALPPQLLHQVLLLVDQQQHLRAYVHMCAATGSGGETANECQHQPPQPPQPCSSAGLAGREHQRCPGTCSPEAATYAACK